MFSDLLYQLADYVPYSADIWRSLIETINLDHWPESLVLLPILALLITADRMSSRFVDAFSFILLALCWAFSAWVFLAQHYAPLYWVAEKIIPFFLIQAFLLLSFGARCLKPDTELVERDGHPGGILLLVVLLALPALQFVFGNSSAQLSWLALSPDATAIITLAWLITTGQIRSMLILIPLAWLGLASLNGLALGLWAEALLLPAALVMINLYWRPKPVTNP
ncbi:MAG: hypothetical protein AAF402_03230 [Pseudomonadota bacterium]